MLTRTTSPAGAGNVGAGGPLSWLMRCVERNFDFGKLLRRFLGLHRVQSNNSPALRNYEHVVKTYGHGVKQNSFFVPKKHPDVDIRMLAMYILTSNKSTLWSGKQWQNELHGFIAAYSGYNEWEPKQNNVLWVHQEPFDNNLIRNYLQNEQDPSIADFVDKNLDFITQNTPFRKSADRFWSGIIQKQAHQLNKALTKSRVSWRKLFASTPSNNNTAISPIAPVPSSSSPSHPLSSFSLPTLKARICQQDKDALRERFRKFIDVHKKDFWLLDSTKAQAAEEGTDLVSVEEKVMDFALKCDFYQ
ncbi:hypothetical protein BDB00DRAFT_878104 [Zychaea mexicana]|uniref:uncharacterized protein n=1 Tax=Zychaea mexicana TaxID=64656 RepID=UPI0022FF2930|nr:uncharacterized protein BDB00DRAFT_878104 [Zychaea mexicana]KAI9485075.1 hypothetical protein BDB00DRAFT_878104 [Zychaea mexicana]